MYIYIYIYVCLGSDFPDFFFLRPGANLNAGQLNGEYSYVDPGTTPGVWVYRVQEEDLEGKRSTLSQTIIEVQVLC
jgi:hypothetical protein